MGWESIGDSWYYLHSGGGIGGQFVQVKLDCDMPGYALPGHAESYQDAIKASLRLAEVAPCKISIPLLALVYLSPLNQFLNLANCEPAFVTMLVGQTGTMKSTLAALFLSHFGEFTAKSLPGSFKDTKNALEFKGYALKDTLMVVDDFYPSAQRGQYTRMEDVMQSLLRSYGDRSARARLGADIKPREAYAPMAICLSQVKTFRPWKKAAWHGYSCWKSVLVALTRNFYLTYRKTHYCLDSRCGVILNGWPPKLIH